MPTNVIGIWVSIAGIEKTKLITVTMRRKCLFFHSFLSCIFNETCQPIARKASVRSDGTVSDHRDRRTVGLVSAHPVCEIMRHQMCIEVMLDLEITARANLMRDGP
jgi:hypothetical protein